MISYLRAYPLCTIFSTATLVRLFFAYLFYGSTDVSSFIAINSHTFNQTLQTYPYLIWCAFPVFPWYLWLSGWLAVATPLPLAFCFKLIPVFFDGLLAVLLYQFVASIRPKESFAVGILYAICPVSIMITCIHGQWDSMPLFCLVLAFVVRYTMKDSVFGSVLYGALFAFSFLLKPLSLIVFPFFFIPYKGIAGQFGRMWVWLCGVAIVLTSGLLASFIVFKQQQTFTVNDLIHTISSGWYVYALVLLKIVCLSVIVYIAPWRSFSVRFKQFLWQQSFALIGLVAMVAICFTGFILYGFNVISMFDKIFRYLNTGITTHGLPFAYPFNQGLLATVFKNRFWMMGLIGCVAWQYYKERIDLFVSVLLSFLIVFSFGTLSPQYLIWITPFFLLTGAYRLFVAYNVVVTVFLLVYYMHPYANPVVPYQSMMSFAPLLGFDWLLPPVWMTQSYMLSCVHLLGNYALPAVCMISIICIIGRSGAGMVRMSRVHQEIVIPYVGMLLGLTGGIGLCMMCVNTEAFAPVFNMLCATRFERYITHSVDGCLSGDYGVVRWLNGVHILAVILVGWSVYALGVARYKK